MRVDLSNSWKRSSEPEQFSNLSATQILIPETAGARPDQHVLVEIDRSLSRAGVQPRIRVRIKHALKSVCCHGIASYPQAFLDPSSFLSCRFSAYRFDVPCDPERRGSCLVLSYLFCCLRVGFGCAIQVFPVVSLLLLARARVLSPLPWLSPGSMSLSSHLFYQRSYLAGPPLVSPHDRNSY